MVVRLIRTTGGFFMDAMTSVATRTLEFGIYRDGDNNLDESQVATLREAVRDSARNTNIEYAVEDTTSLGGDGQLHTNDYTIADGGIGHASSDHAARDMASPQNLAHFVARVLDRAEANGAKQSWIELTDHGAGDGGGLEADSNGHIMSMPSIARAIADGIAEHAREHPEDAGRKVDGVVANQCLMASLGFGDALSHAGVRYLAASPETMISPGVPSAVAGAIERHEDDAPAMGAAVVRSVMQHRYGDDIQPYGPAAAFDVLDLGRTKMQTVENAVKRFNDDVAAVSRDDTSVTAIRDDARSVPGMVRFPDSTPDMPWHADRPAIALYGAIASDGRIDQSLRADANNVERAVRNLVVAHAESRAFAPFGGRSYADAAGPTTHFPIDAKQIDPWAPKISETQNRFFRETDAAAAERVLA